MSDDEIDVRLIQPFINATLKVLETMAFTEAEASAPYLKNDEIAKGDLSGVIGMTGDGRHGSLSVSFPKNTILGIVSNMFGEEKHEVDGEIKDAVGEITNMISGQGRQELERNGISLSAAIPAVISGKEHSIRHITDYPITAVTFTLTAGEFDIGKGGEFTIEFCLEDA